MATHAQAFIYPGDRLDADIGPTYAALRIGDVTVHLMGTDADALDALDRIDAAVRSVRARLRPAVSYPHGADENELRALAGDR